MNTKSATQLSITIDISDINVIEVTQDKDSNWIFTVATRSNTAVCGVCKKDILCQHGCGRMIELRHLSILGKATYIRIAPKRGKCPDCINSPTTSQKVDWYEPYSPHTKAYDAHLMRQLKGSTVMDVSRIENVGYDAILGALKRQIPIEIAWDGIQDLETIGIDEVSIQKGRRKYRAVITARQSDGQRHILAVLPDRKKNGQSILRDNSC